MKDILDGWPLERAQLCHVFPPAPAVRLNPIAAGHSMPLRSCLRWESRPLSGGPVTSCDGDASVGGCCRECGPRSPRREKPDEVSSGTNPSSPGSRQSEGQAQGDRGTRARQLR
jgi:hypothetical protein